MKKQLFNLKEIDTFLLIWYLFLIIFIISVKINDQIKKSNLQKEINLIYIEALDYLKKNNIENE
jgi:hypothetical protein